MGLPRAVLVVTLVALLCVGGSAARPLPYVTDLAFTESEIAVTMDDGVAIAATLFVPQGSPPAGGWPAILMTHGIGESRTALNAVGIRINDVARDYLADQGYVVLTFDQRGHGQSGGVTSIAGAREAQDVRILFDWLAARLDVNRQRIGAYAYSLGGGVLRRAAVAGVPFAAMAVAVTWVDLVRSLLAGGVPKSGVIFGFTNAVPAERLAPEIRAAATDALAGRNLDLLRQVGRDRSTAGAQVRIPTMVLQGRRDFAFDLAEGLAAFRSLGGPKYLYFAGFGHAPAPKPPAEIPHAMDRVRSWFDRFLKDIANGIDTGPDVELSTEPWTGRTVRYRGLPPTSVRSFTARGRSTIGATGAVNRTVGRTTTRLETFGAPVVRVSVSGTYPHLIAVLKAIPPGGAAITVSEGGIRTVLSTRPRTVSIPMISQATVIPRGSRLVLRLGPVSGDLLYLNTVPSGSRLAVGTVTLRMPVLLTAVSR